MSAVRGKADVPATWSGSLLVAIIGLKTARVPGASSTTGTRRPLATAIRYTLARWASLTRFDDDGQATVSGVDVSFYLTENSGMNANITVSGGANVSLSAPSDGPLPGVLFYQDRDAPSNVTHRFTGNAEMDFDGVLYFPNQALQFSGNSELEDSEALIIADTIDFTGNTEVELETAPDPANPLLAEASLVE